MRKSIIVMKIMWDVKSFVWDENSYSYGENFPLWLKYSIVMEIIFDETYSLWWVE